MAERTWMERAPRLRRTVPAMLALLLPAACGGWTACICF
jgi:hypothetical protein